MDIFWLVKQRNKISTCWYSILGRVYQLKVTKETTRMCLMLRFFSVWLFLDSAITSLVLNLNMTGGSASSCSSLREALFCFLQGDFCLFSPACLTECSNLPPLCMLVKFCHRKPTCASHRETQNYLGGKIPASAWSCELWFLLNWKEQSSNMPLLPAKMMNNPNCAQYCCILLFHTFLPNSVGKTSIFNLDRWLSVKMHSSVSIPHRNVQASNWIGKYGLILFKLLIDVVTNGT